MGVGVGGSVKELPVGVGVGGSADIDKGRD